VSSTERHKELVVQFLDAMAANDVKSLRALVTDNAKWWVPPTAAGLVDRPLVGGDAVAQLAGGQVTRAFRPGTTTWRIRHVTAEADRVSILMDRCSTTAGGAPYENEYHWLFRFVDGRIAEVWEIMDTALARTALAVQELSSFWQLVEDAAEADPALLVVSDDHGRSLTRDELREAGERVAAALSARGVHAGTVVSWQLPSTIEAVVLTVALARLGAVQNPLVPLLRERELSFITAQARTELLIVPSVWKGFEHGALARELGRGLGFEALEIDLSELDHVDEHELLLPMSANDALPAPVSSPDDRWLYYSSGTTAEPKGARHRDTSIIASSNALVDLMGFGADDVYPIAWPMAHIGGAGVLAASLRSGTHLVLFDEFDIGRTPLRMAKFAPTIVGTAVPFFRAFLGAQRARGDVPVYPALRFGCFGGAPVPADVHEQMREVFEVALVGMWGLTEFPNATSARPDDEPELLLTSVGQPASQVQVRVVGAEGRICEPGREGELQLRGPQCFSGYLDAALDAEAFSDGWFRTGDLGTVDANGNVRITGRLKEIIIRNAENISVGEVEEFLFGHPLIADAAVFGVADARTGERVVAAVVPLEGATLDLAMLRGHCQEQGLAIQKCPEELLIVDAVPRNAMGKVLRQELRSQVG
jgi:acyl-CoA synthetase (AMP-forming)/AMP-acid ligase II/ketosteroid isomerase-like protein